MCPLHTKVCWVYKKFVARDGFDIKEEGLDKKPAAVKSEKKKK